jgi:alkanesulfonate monooxygenase SsuD/methylene tetrahydromethanopterin reductase-like flavin-dependent oxidoreductase (luciferase family)
MTLQISAELSHVCPLEEITQHAMALESAGYHRVWIPDTLVSPWEAWMAAGIVMHHTNHIGIGLGVTNPSTRHPVVVAQMAATLQNYSGGRLAISMGKGIGRFLEKAGIDQHAETVAECIDLLHRLIAGERTSLKGDAFQIDGILLRTSPPKVDVPIYLAAIGPDSWNTALRVADGVATFWNEFAVKNHKQAMETRYIPTAALVPFSVSPGEFFGKKIASFEELAKQVDGMEQAGFDEVIIAYKDLADLEIAAQLIKHG